MTGIHISQATDKTAHGLVQTDLIMGDGYHDCIWSHAEVLTRHGYGNYGYISMALYGSTFWRDADGWTMVVTVKDYGWLLEESDANGCRMGGRQVKSNVPQ